MPTIDAYYSAKRWHAHGRFRCRRQRNHVDPWRSPSSRRHSRCSPCAAGCSSSATTTGSRSGATWPRYQGSACASPQRWPAEHGGSSRGVGSRGPRRLPMTKTLHRCVCRAELPCRVPVMIDRIIVENFKSLRRVDLTLGRMNLFVGANASGKSNFLDLLRVLQGIGNGFTIGEIFDGKPKSATSAVWDGIRGGRRQACFTGAGQDRGRRRRNCRGARQVEGRMRRETVGTRGTAVGWRARIEMEAADRVLASFGLRDS